MLLARPLRESPYHRAVGPTKLGLLVLAIALQFADVVTTNHGLMQPGVWEGNPFIILCMAGLGVFWWAPLKLGFVAYLLLAVPRIRWTWPLALVTGLSAAIVGNNLAYW